MNRTSHWLTGTLLLLLFVTGCAGAYGQGVIVKDTRYPDHRRSRHDVRHDYYRAIERDVRAYVYRLDRQLYLRPRQQRRIGRLLAERTHALLRHTRPYDHRYVYPFPRRYDTRQQVRWWKDTDKRIMKLLDKHQRREYRRLVRHGGGYHDDRYDRYDRRHRYDDRYDRRDRRRHHDDDDDDGYYRGDDDDDD